MKLEKMKSKLENRETGSMLPIINFSVLALLTQKEDSFYFVLNKRSAKISQPNDICFSGGRQEKEETLLQTALRETEEEIGIYEKDLMILGETDYFYTPYGAKIQPFLAYTSYDAFKGAKLNQEEVSEIFLAPISNFQINKPKQYELSWQAEQSETFPYHLIENKTEYHFRKPKTTYLFYTYENRVIWGLTAHIIHNILEVLEDIL